jgi:hypothetical protein
MTGPTTSCRPFAVGALLQNHGVPLVLRGDFDSCLIHLVREIER